MRKIAHGERLRSFITWFLPAGKWKTPVLLLLGVCAGVVVLLVHVSKAFSYLGDEPETCVNCHIMAPQYATWSHSSHRRAATCNDCHVPHDNLARKYYFKGMDGLRHSAIFTMRREPQVIYIHEAGMAVVQENCLRCHEALFENGMKGVESLMIAGARSGRQCRECHREVPHGRVNSLASAPFARVPLPSSPVPEWLRSVMRTEH